uniref:Uncharacterized protein n=1 Tax=Anguilla anguilla TaxID=7936 RepID=A0A0E9VN71_ANGAN
MGTNTQVSRGNQPHNLHTRGPITGL